MLRRLTLAIAAVLLVCRPAAGQNAQRPPACTAPQYRAFDYWIGEWDVTDTTGTKIAESSITRVSAGCAIAEQWRPLQGPEGRSLSWYAARDSMWHQQWIGGDGWAPRFDGTVDDGELVFTETGPQARITRMRYVKKPDGVVQQILWVSTDRGTTWSVAFVGNYIRKP